MITLEAIASTGTRQAFTMHGSITVKTYPPQEVPAREWRREVGLTLRHAAGLLGLRPSEVSDLERGAARPVEGWDALKATYDGWVRT